MVKRKKELIINSIKERKRELIKEKRRERDNVRQRIENRKGFSFSSHVFVLNKDIEVKVPS